MMEFLASSPPYLWLVLMIAFAVLEGVTVTLVSLWFAVGALAALLTSLLFHSVWVQLFVFAVVSLVSLLLVRPIAQNILQPHGPVRVNADRVLEREGVVLETVDNLAAKGQVKVAGQIWTARSQEEEVTIPEGTKVRILRIEGVKVFVEPVE